MGKELWAPGSEEQGKQQLERTGVTDTRHKGPGGGAVRTSQEQRDLTLGRDRRVYGVLRRRQE